ncbi:MAG TPA: AEC family transporter [Victivallales bacterium]|nr:AEC family transporter [Victivallales bacterium]
MILHILNSILPVFILIFIGWSSVKFKIVDSSARRVCSTLVSGYVFPALLFIETANAAPSDILDIKWITAFFVAMFLIWGISFFFGIKVFKQNIKESSMQAMLCAFPNMGGMGIPFLMQVIGVSALLSVAKANFVVALTLIPLTLILLELDSSSSATKREMFIKAILKSLKKPMFIAVLAGAFISLAHIRQFIPDIAMNSMNLISKACVFVSLFAVGVALYSTKLRLSKIFLFNLFTKSILAALIAWLITLIFNITGNDAKELIFLLAMPTATIATILAYQWEVQAEEASSIYLASTAFSIITLPVLMFLLN